MGTQTYKTSESFSADGSGRATAARATSANSIHLSSKLSPPTLWVKHMGFFIYIYIYLFLFCFVLKMWSLITSRRLPQDERHDRDVLPRRPDLSYMVLD